MSYLFIAYKSSSNDYCHGCLWASYGSGFEIENNLDWASLKKLYAKYVLKNQELSYNEEPWTFYVFKNGSSIIKEGKPYWDGWTHNDDLYEEEKKLEQEYESEGYKLLSEVVHPIEELKKQKEEAARKEKERLRKVADEEAKEYRKQQYLKLKQEFETNNGT